MTLGQLLALVIPLSVVSALSPMMLIQSSTLVMQLGRKAAFLYFAGQATILIVIAPAGLSVMGNLAATWVEREVASKKVNVVLGLLLFAFAASVTLRTLRQARRHAEPKQKPVLVPTKGAYLFGLLNAASDYTGIIVFAAIAQRTGAAQIGLISKILIVTLCAAIILIPAWLPIIASRLPHYDRLVSRIGGVLARVAVWGTVLSSVVGGVILVWHGLS